MHVRGGRDSYDDRTILSGMMAQLEVHKGERTYFNAVEGVLDGFSEPYTQFLRVLRRHGRFGISLSRKYAITPHPKTQSPQTTLTPPTSRHIVICEMEIAPP